MREPTRKGHEGHRLNPKYLVPTGFPELPFSRQMNVDYRQEADK